MRMEGATVSTEKLKELEVPVLPALSVCDAVMDLPLPCPMVLRLLLVRV